MSLMRLEKITKRFGSGDQQMTALNQIDLTIEKGQFIGLTGPSGSGKTTLLTIMGSLQSPSDGQLYFKDREIGHLTEKERSALRFNDFGFILQSSNLVSFLTVSEQFELVDRLRQTPSPNKAEDLLKELGVLEQQRQYPASLSGGQRQRVAIARALYGQPDLIFADEPTASLDSKRAIQVAEQLSAITKKTGQTIVMVSHDERVLAYTDQVYIMRDGQLTDK
ncbi:ABC transporter ATP-binding protein [Latilactobacillus sakei]|uniref:Putative hemin import ATP-binding protein HrtA n=2 Tax=Latilactobacillus sakei TaxID=1599 RepID=A0AAX0VB14_LATSK|nr:ABC transporter ATP-binding protein [Latilactobacillus sakei]ASN13523.1 hemin ABC transporter ATP-binding protein [Latilactobacillus sakei]AUX12829.1 ABC transporter ATP-binding protein [Latilactobacillus sakei]MCM1635256.1 ABC transporter ATP-binding protein [Latilactobacillus sakei]PKX61467.1 ABC transporter ATP-binding protein [Latilactobacillus sakei]PKX70558.1 ABC transporter ATP-binding protein [Latilactobacillus sakei]